MSIDNENDAFDAENPASAGVATAPSLDDLDAAMAALIRAASPSESTQAQSASQEPARTSGPAMALVNSVSIMDEDDDDDFFDDDEEEVQEVQEVQDVQEAAPVAQQYRPSAPAPIPFRAPQAQQEPQQAPQMHYQAPQQTAAEYVPPQQQFVPPQPSPQQEYVAPQPVAQQQHEYYPPPQAVAQPEPVAPPQPVQQIQQPQPQHQVQPLQEQAAAPQPMAYQQPLQAAQPVSQQAQAAAQQNSVTQHARATLMHDTTNQDKHLHDASKYIRHWLEENTHDEEVIEAAMDWARKHKTAEHNGHVISSLLKLQQVDNEVTVMAVRWLTHHSMHPIAPEVVAGLTSRQGQ